MRISHGRSGRPFENAEGSMSKLKAGEVAVWATERAIQILGGKPVAVWPKEAAVQKFVFPRPKA